MSWYPLLQPEQKCRQFPRIGVALLLLPVLTLVPVCHGTPRRLLRERTESYRYYQDGHEGRETRRVLTVDLDGGITMDFVRIVGGEFHMGSANGRGNQLSDEEWHGVRITRSFFLSKHEVTRAQFGAFVKETGYRTEAESDGGWGYNATTDNIEGRSTKYSWRFTGFAQSDSHPIVNVTWNDARLHSVAGSRRRSADRRACRRKRNGSMRRERVQVRRTLLEMIVRR
jgi:formylglycine-generating enzyme required for sulfatase activity